MNVVALDRHDAHGDRLAVLEVLHQERGCRHAAAGVVVPGEHVDGGALVQGVADDDDQAIFLWFLEIRHVSGNWVDELKRAVAKAADKDRAAYFEAAAEGRDAKIAANWVTGEVFARLNKDNVAPAEAPVPPSELAALLDMLGQDKISGRQAKEAFEIMWSEAKGAATVVEENGLAQMSDAGALAGMVDDVIAGNQDKVAEYKSGKTKLIGFFVGQVMKASQGKANPKTVNEMLREKLEG